MDSLPPHVLLNILSNLRGTKVATLRRVNKSFCQLIETDKTLTKPNLQPPTVSLKLDQNVVFFNTTPLGVQGPVFHEDKTFTMTLWLPKGAAQFQIFLRDKTIKPVVMKKNAAMTALLESYFHSGGGFDSRSHIDMTHFLMWLLPKVILENLEIRKFNGETLQYQWIVDAIIAAGTRVANLVMDSTITHTRDANLRANGDFVMQLAAHRPDQAKKLNLLVDMILSWKTHSSHWFFLNNLYKEFGKVTVEFHDDEIVRVLRTIIRDWLADSLLKVNFEIRQSWGMTSYGKGQSDIKALLAEIERLNITAVCQRDWEFIRKHKYCYWIFDRLEFQRNDTKDSILFTFPLPSIEVEFKENTEH